MPTDPVSEAKRILEAASDEVRQAVLVWLRSRHPIHPIEADWRVPAEVILEAIARSPDLSKRGVRGLIAEAFFDQMVSAGVPGWNKVPVVGNQAFDCLLSNGACDARIQVKSQRRIRGAPMDANRASRLLSPGNAVVETQKTRAGEAADGTDTRPYRFSDFDILAVSMEASTGEWTKFHYVPARWLLPRRDNPTLLMKFQPVSIQPNEDWTDQLSVALERFLSGKARTISA